MFLTHTQETIDEILGVYLDDEGSLLLLTNRGIGVVDDRDLEGLSTYLRLDGGDADAGRIKAAIDDVQAGKRSQLVIE